ncbi:MAG: hypothetical protein NW220_15525 [Leptolyngbyaceae cyanobacterium bins.349]|nr:hypothetical protein [Leptolyngbyaceae cyanobacterium bins.349]
MNARALVDLSKRIFTPGRSLLLPMLVLALGLHAALLALPIPSNERPKDAEDKKNPITISQIPTEQAATKSSPSGSATVNVPPMATSSASPSASETAASASTETSAATASGSSSSAASTSTSTPASSAKSSTRTNAAQMVDSSSAASNANDSSSTEGTTEAAPSEAPSSEVTASSPNAPTDPPSETATNPFAEFPHYQPSEADCFGLGFGENCRIVANGAIAEVAKYFKQELAAKEFTTNVVSDTPNRKVFKVTKGDKTLFLNIWQGKDQVSYLLSKVVLKQSPADIKTEAEK